MSSIKASIKEAREAIGAKRYRDALVACKAALAEDKGCYEAYV